MSGTPTNWFNDFRLIMHSLVAILLLAGWIATLAQTFDNGSLAELAGSAERLRSTNSELTEHLSELDEATVHGLFGDVLSSELAAYEALESVALNIPKAIDVVLAVLIFIVLAQIIYFLIRRWVGDPNHAARLNLIAYILLMVGTATLVIVFRDIPIEWAKWWAGVTVGLLVGIGIYRGYRALCVFALLAMAAGALTSLLEGRYFLREIALLVVYLDATIAVFAERRKQTAASGL